jgi:hypothetical protein
MAAAARWKLERGAEIGLLETLMGSRTVGSAVVTLAQMGRLNLGVLGLLALWAISPLGGQAFLRILSVEPRIESEPAEVSYFDTNAVAKINYKFFTDDSFPTHQSLMTTIYRALIIGPGSSKEAPMDLWGNVKTPFLQEVGGSDEEWVAVRKDGVEGISGIPYASLLGVPLGLPPSSSFASGNVSFLLESSYVDLQCSILEIFATVPTYELESFEEPAPKLFDITNGPWWMPCLPNGMVTTVPRCRDENALWAIALDRFIDRLWAPAFERVLYSPAQLTNEDGIEAGKTRLWRE